MVQLDLLTALLFLWRRNHINHDDYIDKIQQIYHSITDILMLTLEIRCIKKKFLSEEYDKMKCDNDELITSCFNQNWLNINEHFSILTNDQASSIVNDGKIILRLEFKNVAASQEKLWVPNPGYLGLVHRTRNHFELSNPHQCVPMYLTGH